MILTQENFRSIRHKFSNNVWSVIINVIYNEVSDLVYSQIWDKIRNSNLIYNRLWRLVKIQIKENIKE